MSSLTPAKTASFPVLHESTDAYEAHVFVRGGARGEKLVFKQLAKLLSKPQFDYGRNDRAFVRVALAELQFRYPSLIHSVQGDAALESTVRETFKSAKPLDFLYVSRYSKLAASHHRVAVRSVHDWGFRARLVTGVRSFEWSGMYAIGGWRGFTQAHLVIRFPREAGPKAGSLELFPAGGMLARAWG